MRNLFKLFVISLFVFSFNAISFAQEMPTVTEKENTFVVNVDFHCGGGKARLEKGLKEVEGVKSVVADLETKNVTIVHDSDVVKTKELVLAIEEIGHKTEFTHKDKKVKSACTHGEDGDHDHDHDHEHKN